jgi:hypothetical protein
VANGTSNGTQADEATRRAIAADAAVGTPPAHIAMLYGRSAAGVRAMLSTEDMQNLVASEKNRLNMRRQIARLKAQAVAPEVMDKFIAKALDDEHKDSLAAGKVVLETAEVIGPAAASGGQTANFNLHVGGDALERVARAMASAQEVFVAKDEPILITGSDVVPTPEHIAKMDADLAKLADSDGDDG